MLQPPTLLIGQSGGATAVINASLVGSIQQAQQGSRWQRILGLSHGIEGLFKHRYIDLTRIDATTLARVANTPSAVLGTGRFKLKDDDLARAVLTMQTLGITGFAYIGGNDSADTAHRIGKFARNIGYELQVMSIPKTIDNDLPDTDFCPGYPSLARYLGNAMRDATYDTIASPQIYPVKFMEVMGRDAGWVAASCTAAFGDNEQDLLPILLLPERAPKSTDEVLEAIQQQIDDRGFSMVVLPETMRTSENQHFGGDEPEYVDSFGHPYFPSTGAAMTRLVQQNLGVRARYDKPGTSARMSIALASPVDLEMAHRLGAAAVEAMENGKTGTMTALRRTGDDPVAFEIELVPQTNVANRVRHLDEAFIGKDGRSVTQAFHDYLRPLLGEHPFPAYARFDEPVHVEGTEIPSLSRIRESTMLNDPNRGDLLSGDLEVGVDVNDGVDGTGVDARGHVFAIRIGQDVIGKCGNKIGEVVDVRDDYVVVEKGFFNPVDIYVPKNEIISFDQYHLKLRLTRDESDHAGWENAPAEIRGDGGDTRG